MHQRHTFSRQAGFTLIELMVVVAIVAILAVMAAPSYRDMMERMRLRSAADDVVSVLSTARAQSVKIGLDTVISTSAAGANWCVGATSAAVPAAGALYTGGVTTACTCSNSNASGCLVAGERLAVPVGKHPIVTMAAGPTDPINFDGKLGTAIPLNGNRTIRLTTPNHEVRVAVTPLGQATLCTPDSMAGITPC